LEPSERSYLKISYQDLRRLAAIARHDRQDFFSRHPRWKNLYENRILCVALCQGAALHFVDGKNGIKDWDVWTFYRSHSEAPFPYRRRGENEFGVPRFGRCLVRSDFSGRCVDLIGRSIEAAPGEDPAISIRRYLSQGRTMSSRKLAEKAVIIIDPVGRCGEVVFPQNVATRGFTGR